MMMDRIRRALGRNAEMADWRIVESRRRGWERYYIGRAVECAREVETTEYRVTVYADGTRDGQAVRGDSIFRAHPTMDLSELEAAIGRALFAASRVANKPYDLPLPASTRAAMPVCSFEGGDPSGLVERVRAELYREDGAGGATVNSLELFLSRVETRIVNSRGVDASWVSWKGFSEYVVNAPSPSGEVELYGSVKFGDFDAGKLSRAVGSRLAQARDRSRAEPTPDARSLPILFSEDNAGALFGYFFANCSAQRAYQKLTPFKPGASAQGETVTGDRVTLHAEAALRGHPDSSPFDDDGVPIDRFTCVEDGVVGGFFGPSRYCGYLGIPASGDYRVFSVDGGRETESALRALPHFEPVVFSDFFVDAATGDFGGEVRLGYLFDGTTRIPVTGGSVTGSMLDARGSLRFSGERIPGGAGIHPAVVLVAKASVTPAG